MACRLFGAKPLSEPVLVYNWFDRWEQTSVTFNQITTIFIQENEFKMQNIGHFVWASVCQMSCRDLTNVTSGKFLLGRHSWVHGSLTRYAKLRVGHAPGMPGTFSPPPRVSDPDMHHGTCVTHVPWCIPGSLTNVPGIPGACATRNFTYLVRGPWEGARIVLPAVATKRHTPLQPKVVLQYSILWNKSNSTILATALFFFLSHSRKSISTNFQSECNTYFT